MCESGQGRIEGLTNGLELQEANLLGVPEADLTRCHRGVLKKVEPRRVYYSDVVLFVTYGDARVSMLGILGATRINRKCKVPLGIRTKRQYLQWSWLWSAAHNLLPVREEACPILDRASAEDRRVHSTDYRRGTEGAAGWLMLRRTRKPKNQLHTLIADGEHVRW